MSATKKSMLTANQEVVVDFLNTHLAMTMFLMPWKRVTVTVGTGIAAVSTNSLWTLFDFLNVDKWMIAAGKPDDSLVTKTHVFIGLCVALLLSCILSFGTSVFYTRETGLRFGLDFINFALGSVILILAITFQGDFDAYWKHTASGATGTVTDYEQMFLVVGVAAVQVFLSLVCMGDKFKEVFDKYI
jgi:hypothetical protein